jgi:hypothetical protein
MTIHPSEVRAQLSSCNFGDFPTRGTQFIVNFLTPEFGPSRWSYYEPVTGLHVYLNRAWACHFIFTSSSCGPISMALWTNSSTYINLWNTMEITGTRRTRAKFACQNCSKCHTKVLRIFFQLCYIKGWMDLPVRKGERLPWATSELQTMHQTRQDMQIPSWIDDAFQEAC